jgi:Domain of unknown function (DUF4178)
MNFDNPTRIRIGMTGDFFGRTYRVLGRVFLGETQERRIYTWTEFNLQTEAGESATLVFEQTDNGPEWRWFTMFEPNVPFPAEEAESKQVGDVVNLDGADARIDLMQESRIYYIEGQAPEGQKVCSQAKYFNAREGEKMIVVSWTGKEMEYYKGIDITRQTVATAFCLEPAELLKFQPSVGSPTDSALQWKLAAYGIIGFVIFILLVASMSESASRPAAVVRYPSTEAPFSAGVSGLLRGTNYHAVGHALVEIAETGVIANRHEYYLQDNDGNPALLIYGFEPGAKDWYLFIPQQPSPWTPKQAGNFRIGQTVNTFQTSGLITELFRSTLLQVENTNSLDLSAGQVKYGFCAHAGPAIIMARWNENGIDLEQGTQVPAAVITAAFGKVAAK